MAKDHFLLFEHVEGLELFRLKQIEDLQEKSFSNYMQLMEAVDHVSTFETSLQSDLNSEIRKMLILNDVKILHCDRSLKTICKEMNIEQRDSMSLTRGIKTNINQIRKKNQNNQVLLAHAHKFSRNKVGEQRDDSYVVHVGYEMDQVEKELLQIENMLKNKLNLRSINEDDSSATKLDSKEILLLKKLLDEKMELFTKLKLHLASKMKVIAPNTREIIGDRILYRMLHKTGGLHNMAMYPASTIQLLGAEKSLFISLKMKKNTPKHGMIFELLKENKQVFSNGKISRDIANKVAIAAKIDNYDPSTNRYGIELRKSVDKKMVGEKETETTEQILERVSKELSN
ncbi:NOP56 [Enterospora canceri]|uniref:NOP56 n=1 Tax=Enterospora canceri TaxID=1081671 RepID=A0A1Y1S6W5_9MICR|nr:NOP56 [Enterospora canceri]